MCANWPRPTADSRAKEPPRLERKAATRTLVLRTIRMFSSWYYLRYRIDARSMSLQAMRQPSA